MFRIVFVALILMLVLAAFSGEKECHPDTPEFTKVPASPEAKQFIKLITDMAGISDHILVYGVDNWKNSGLAMASMCGGRRWIFYDVNSFMQFDVDGYSNWEVIGVLAHEIGHLASTLGGHHGKAQHQSEEEADLYAGYVIGRLGGTRDNAYRFTDFLPEESSKTHPGRAHRKQVAIEGWKKAQYYMRYEQKRCVQHAWHGEPFVMQGKMCRIVNICSAAEIQPRVACKNKQNTWDLE